MLPTAAHAQSAGWPDWNPVNNRWQLGVRVQNTTTGAQIIDVEPGSPAAASGLVKGDRIVAIGGRQIGYVDGRLNDLGEAINQSVNTSGQVTTLLHSTRYGLAARTIGLRSTENVIEGTAYLRGGARLSSQAVLNFRLLDVTHSNWTGVVVFEWSIGGASYSPYPFRLSYNPQQIYAGHQYALEAAVVDQSTVMFRTSQPLGVELGSGRVSISLDPLTTQLPGVGGGTFPYDQVANWYRTYLGRPPTQQELYSWQNHVERGQPISDVQTYLLGSNEFYGRYQNNNDLYLRGIFRTLYDRDPTPQELSAMQQRFQAQDGVRTRFVQTMLAAGAGP